jgi:hypothetical protein
MWSGRHCREGGELRWYGHVKRRDEGEPVTDIMELGVTVDGKDQRTDGWSVGEQKI